MRRAAFAILVLLMTLTTSAAVKVIAIKHAEAPPAGFCDPFDVCDQFNTTNNPATGWTAGPGSGAWQTNGTEMVPPTGTVTATYDTTVGGATQYAIVKIVESADETGVTMRRGNGEIYYYVMYWNGSGAYWAIRVNANDEYKTESADCATVAFNDGDYLAATVSGTGAGTTTVKIWNKGQTAPTTPPLSTDTCSTLCCTFTDDLTWVSDTGNQVGLYIYTGSTVRRFDDFAGGNE